MMFSYLRLQHLLATALMSSYSLALGCPEVTGVCDSTDPATFQIPILNLSRDSSHRPIINGIIDRDEYTSFLELPMFDGGENGKSGSPLDKEGRIGTSYLAYDFKYGILCVAARQDSFSPRRRKASNNEGQVSTEDVGGEDGDKANQHEDETDKDGGDVNGEDGSDGTIISTEDRSVTTESIVDSWVQFGAKGTKLSNSNADVFEFVGTPDSSVDIIGFEGCWTMKSDDPELQSILNNKVEVYHESPNGSRMSTGNDETDGRNLCLTPWCPVTTASDRGSEGSESTTDENPVDSSGNNYDSHEGDEEDNDNSEADNYGDGVTSQNSADGNFGEDYTGDTGDTEEAEKSNGGTKNDGPNSEDYDVDGQDEDESTGDGSDEDESSGHDGEGEGDDHGDGESEVGGSQGDDNDKDEDGQDGDESNGDGSQDEGGIIISTSPSAYPSKSPSHTTIHELASPSNSPTTYPSSSLYPSSSPSCDFTTIDAVNNKVTIPVNSSIDIQVLDNDIRSSYGFPLDIKNIVFRGTHGECKITNEGKIISYTPNSEFYGTDTCIYTACDEKRRCDSAAVIINVTPVIAYDDSVTTDINVPVDIFPSANDISAVGHPLSVVSIESNAQNGDCVLVSQQVVVYIPNPNFHGSDFCEYQACDDRGVCDSAVINITIDGTPCDEKEDRIITSSPVTPSPSSVPVAPPPSGLDGSIRPTGQPVSMDSSNHPTQYVTSEPVSPIPNIYPTHYPTVKPVTPPTNPPTHLSTANPLTPAPTSHPTRRPTAHPSTSGPTENPTTAPPSIAPTPCDSRSFFLASGVCTNALDQDHEAVYATLKDCCNANFGSGCCQFQDVCYEPPINDLNSDDVNEACYELWRSKTYEVGDKVTGKDGKNYACNADFYLYCSWAAFEPGTGSSIDYYKLAWDELPTICHTRVTNRPSPSPGSVSTTSPVLHDCPAYFDKFHRSYSAGDLATYNGLIYQCITSNGRCIQDGYEPWSPLAPKESWVVVGKCNSPWQLRGRRVYARAE